MIIKTHKGLKMVLSPALEARGSLVHGFLTRRYGQMVRPAKSRATIKSSQAAPPDQEASVSALAAAFKIDEGRIIRLGQVHSSNVLIVPDDVPLWKSGKIAPFDAAVTALRGVLLTVSTADCAPILLFDEARGVVAAAHSGWRGSIGGIASKTVGVMIERFGSNPADILGAIGPSIGKCCYEVGTEVAHAVAEAHRSADGLLAPSESGKWLFDLKRLNYIQLLGKGLSPANISVSHYCTKCEPELFHSYRREGVGCQSQISFVGMV